MKTAVIGSGISGLTVARVLTERGESDVVVFEREKKAGGLVRCERVDGSLFHLCGGHVFNSKKQDVLEWFWAHMQREKEFHLADRHSVVYMPDGLIVPYPIENHVYCFSKPIQDAFYADLENIEKQGDMQPTNFDEFLRYRFGETLYRLYFEPYNRKVWRCDLRNVPLSWLEGKLPMPTVEEMRYNNAHHVEEKQFVHSSFYYANKGGSQFIVDKLAEGLDIRYNSPVQELQLQGSQIVVNGELFDRLVWCGNVKDLVSVLADMQDVQPFVDPVNRLAYHGTTAVFCEIDNNPYTWVYQPSEAHASHRIICTGNFAESNNAVERTTATIEFTDAINKEEIIKQLECMPFHPRYITHHYSPATYPIQDADTRVMIKALKEVLAKHHLFITGRFADWEYYNMDVAMSAAFTICRQMNE